MPRLSIMKIASLAPMPDTSGTAFLLYCFSLMSSTIFFPSYSAFPHIGLPVA